MKRNKKITHTRPKTVTITPYAQKFSCFRCLLCLSKKLFRFQLRFFPPFFAADIASKIGRVFHFLFVHFNKHLFTTKTHCYMFLSLFLVLLLQNLANTQRHFSPIAKFSLRFFCRYAHAIIRLLFVPSRLGPLCFIFSENGALSVLFFVYIEHCQLIYAYIEHTSTHGCLTEFYEKKNDTKKKKQKKYTKKKKYKSFARLCGPSYVRYICQPLAKLFALHSCKGIPHLTILACFEQSD